ncbi:MAG: hypothetical protein OXH95_04490, partial [bacterium]|nr:hypothetical protein [bacterium]
LRIMEHRQIQPPYLRTRKNASQAAQNHLKGEFVGLRLEYLERPIQEGFPKTNPGQVPERIKGFSRSLSGQGYGVPIGSRMNPFRTPTIKPSKSDIR